MIANKLQHGEFRGYSQKIALHLMGFWFSFVFIKSPSLTHDLFLFFSPIDWIMASILRKSAGRWRGRRRTTSTRASGAPRAAAAQRQRGTSCCSGATESGCAASVCTAATSARLPRSPLRGPRLASDATPPRRCSTAVWGLCFISLSHSAQQHNLYLA